MEQELTQQKSQEQANIISMIAVPILLLDTDYCRQLADAIVNQANRQDSMAVLNPAHSLSKNDLLRTQASALYLLVEYVERLREVDTLKQTVAAECHGREAINNLFL